jgi:UDP-GlcNAc:undecaprenyl-phosphate/decaprenyl-phosphate GlcNAc-1-phosphate transferase
VAIFCLGIFALSLLLSFALTKYVRDFATLRGWVAAPGSDRHLHVRPLPRLGGVAIFLAFLTSLAIAVLLGRHYPSLGFALSYQSLWSILLPGCLVFFLGVYDDVHPLSPYVKFSGQAIAGALLFAFGLRILDLPVLFGHHHFPRLLSLPLTILWVLAITNAFNLIDGLDGLAAGSALFSTLVVFVVSLFSNSPWVSMMALALAGSILGFLRYNFNPATIFLGDCGSLFIGFMLSALALQGAQKAPTTIAVAIPVVSFGFPIVETVISILRRLIAGRPVFTGDREHIHHKLLEHGLSHRQVVIILYAVSAVFALLSLFLLWPTGSTLGLVLAVLGTGIWFGVQRLGYLEFGELRRVAQRTMEQPQIFVNNLAIRRATEELKVARDYDQLCCILSAAFASNDFDAFDLYWFVEPGEWREIRRGHETGDSESTPCLRWKRPGSSFTNGSRPAWSLTLDLVTGNDSRRGSMTIHRRYSDTALQIDVNLLTTDFPLALAEALDRLLQQTANQASASSERGGFMAAHAG